MLKVENISVSYGAVKAVRGVDIEVGAGEIVALLGANGAGKTSTLMAIMGLVKPETGTVLLDGKPISGLATEQIVRSGLTLTPEGRRVFPNLSVEDNLRLGGVAARSSRARQQRHEEVLDLFPSLRDRLGQSAGTLSGGEQQQLAIARSLMSRPHILMLDEPSLGLAPQIVEVIFALICDLRRRGLTIILVEQNVDLSLEIADRGYVLANGQVVLAGAATDLLASEGVERAYLGLAGA